MKKEINIPFFSTENDKLTYLDRYIICDLPKEESIKKMMLKQYGAIIEKDINTNIDKTIEVLVLEPHPDDFALSAMGYIQENMKVTVLNIFSKMKIDSFTWSKLIDLHDKEYENLRLLESKVAIQDILDYGFVSLKEESTRITKKTIQEIQKSIIRDVKKILEEKKIDIIMIPMGIGEHPDHLCIYEAIINEYVNLNINSVIILYPEYPYARCKKSYIDRLEKIYRVFDLKEYIVNIESKLQDIVNVISVYKSQFDDINKEQMLAIVREDGRAISTEYNKKDISLVYYKIDGRKTEWK